MRLARHSGWLCIIAVVGLGACGVPGIPKPPSLNLAQPVSDLRAVRKGDRVYLSWTVPSRTTDLLAVRHLGLTRICRSANAAMIECGTAVGEVAAPEAPKNGGAAPKQSYGDALPATLLSDSASAEVFYAVSVLNENGRSAGLSNVVAVPAVAAPKPPSDFQAQVTGDGVVVSWKEAQPAGGKRFYRVYRRAEGASLDVVAGEAPWGSDQLIDHNFEWEKTYFYRATVVTIISLEGKPDSQFESADTPAVKVFAHDVFPPAVPSGVQAVFSGVGQQPFVDLIWAPNTDADLAGYNIYRHEDGGEPRKINPALVTAPAFRDTNVVPGHSYFYSVSAVDVRGNESARSGEAGEAVP
ncbi:MAG: fibronectin type III domain-containing protein [Terriglobales bacterium]